jgi:hypothetical protein
MGFERGQTRLSSRIFKLKWPQKNPKDHKEDQFEFLFLRSLRSFAAIRLFRGRDA